MAKKAATRRRKKPAPSPRWGWSLYHDTYKLAKFGLVTFGGFAAGYGGLFATSDNASRLIEAKGWYAVIGLGTLTIVRACMLFFKDNTTPQDCESTKPQ